MRTSALVLSLLVASTNAIAIREDDCEPEAQPQCTPDVCHPSCAPEQCVPVQPVCQPEQCHPSCHPEECHPKKVEVVKKVVVKKVVPHPKVIQKHVEIKSKI